MSVLLAAVTSIYFHIQIKKIKDGKTASDSLFHKSLPVFILILIIMVISKREPLINDCWETTQNHQTRRVNMNRWAFLLRSRVCWKLEILSTYSCLCVSKKLLDKLLLGSQGGSSIWWWACDTHSQEVRWSVSTMEYRRTLKTQILEHNCQLSVSTTQSLQNVVFAIFFPSRYPDTAIILLPVF